LQASEASSQGQFYLESLEFIIVFGPGVVLIVLRVYRGANSWQPHQKRSEENGSDVALLLLLLLPLLLLLLLLLCFHCFHCCFHCCFHHGWFTDGLRVVYGWYTGLATLLLSLLLPPLLPLRLPLRLFFPVD